MIRIAKIREKRTMKKRIAQIIRQTLRDGRMLRDISVGEVRKKRERPGLCVEYFPHIMKYVGLREG